MTLAPDPRRRQLLSLCRRINQQLRALAAIRAELYQMNADQFTRPVAADDHPWLLRIEPARRELTAMSKSVEGKLATE